jgi:hypothetical protein
MKLGTRFLMIFCELQRGPNFQNDLARRSCNLQQRQPATGLGSQTEMRMKHEAAFKWKKAWDEESGDCGPSLEDRKLTLAWVMLKQSLSAQEYKSEVKELTQFLNGLLGRTQGGRSLHAADRR